MDTPLHILALEPSPAAFCWLEPYLRQKGLTAKLLHITDAAGLAPALQAGWDVVLCGLGLADMDLAALLHTLHGHKPDLPVILLCAIADEPQALTGLAVGLRDYIFIEHPARLPAAIRRCVACTHDLRAQHMTVKQLRTRALAIEQSPISVLITGPQARIEYVNEACLRITGYPREEIVGQTPRLLHSGKTPPEHYRAMKATLAKGQTWKGEFINRRKDGSEYLDFAIITPLHDKDGLVTHYVAVQEDITATKRMSEELERYRHHLEDLVVTRTAELEAARTLADAANQAKGTLLANVSHEIRTPMNAIIGLTELCLDTALDPVQRDYLRNARQAAELLKSLTDSILDLSKIEAGAMHFERRDFEFEAFMKRILDTAGALITAGGLKLTLHTDPLIPPHLAGDTLRLGQVLLNLCSNAVKFTPQGSVNIRCVLEHRDAAVVKLHFSVSDTGIGISEEAQQRIFSPFVQADTSTTRNYGGTGLGLAISQKLVTLMGGHIWVESIEGQGSVFHFTTRLGIATPPTWAAPLVESPPGHDAARRPTPLKGYHILIVEDNPFNSQVLRTMLQQSGSTVVEAENGLAAITRLNEDRFDAVLMDVQMPVMDGISATREIRRDPRHAALPIIACTANVIGENRNLCQAVGMDDFITKPLVRADLLQMLHKHLGTPRTASAPPIGPEAVAATPGAGLPDFDVPAALSRIDGDVAQYHIFLDIFRDSNQHCVEQIGLAMGRRDAAAALQLAHGLKGASATIGALRLQAAATLLEDSLAAARFDAELLAGVAAAWQQGIAALTILLSSSLIEPPRAIAP